VNRSLRRIIGILLIVIFSFLEICIVFAFIFGLFYPTRKDGTSEPVYTYIFPILLFAFPIWYGVKLLKETRIKQTDVAEPVSPDEHVKVEVFITAGEYKKIAFILSYQSPATLFFTLIMGFMLIALISNSIAILDYRWFFGLMFFILPISVYYQAGRNYKTNSFLKETIEYEINVDNIIVKGETFSSTVALKNLHKVKETRGLLLLYTNNLTAFLIPKDRFENEDEIEKVRRILGTKNVVL
jgi:hypothetical protein